MQAMAKARENDESPARLNAREERIRANLEAFIKASGYTPTQVADLAGVPQANISRWLSGKSAIAIDALPALRDALGRDSIDDFFSPSPPPQRTKEELAIAQPMFGKARPGFDPSEEDLADFREYLEKVRKRREKKKGKA